MIVLSTDSNTSVRLIPKHLRIKELIEVNNLICSAGISNVFKGTAKNKVLIEWVKRNSRYIFFYYTRLIQWAWNNNRVPYKTYVKLKSVREDLSFFMQYNNCTEESPKTIVFSYDSNYKSPIPNNTEVPTLKGIHLYREYLAWKLNAKYFTLRSHFAFMPRDLNNPTMYTLRCLKCGLLFNPFKDGHSFVYGEELVRYPHATKAKISTIFKKLPKYLCNKTIVMGNLQLNTNFYSSEYMIQSKYKINS